MPISILFLDDMIMQPNEIKQLIEAGLTDASVTVEGDGHHFEAIVISPVFLGKSRIAKQQLVLTPLNAHIADGRLHAISIKTYTPDEWQDLN